MSEVAGIKYKNLSKKYRIDRDDFEAQFERLTRYILETYNFGSELVVLAYLDLIRNGDVPEAKDAGIYRREKGEESKAKNVIRRPSEIEEEARKRKQEEKKRKQEEKKAEAEKKEDPPKGSGIEEQIAGQINIFDEAPAENVKSESDAGSAKEK